MAQLERIETAVVEESAERACSVKIDVAEFLEALLVEEVLWVHFQGAGRRDRARSYVVVLVLRDRCLDSSEVSFQALSVIKCVLLGPETPCWLLVS